MMDKNIEQKIELLLMIALPSIFSLYDEHRAIAEKILELGVATKSEFLTEEMIEVMYEENDKIKMVYQKNMDEIARIIREGRGT